MFFDIWKSKKKREPQISREQALSALPVQNPHVDAEEDEDALTLSYAIEPTKPVRFIMWMMTKFSKEPPPPRRKVELDAVGKFVWNMCDGKHTVQDISKKVGREYRLPSHEAEHSTVLFLKTLAGRGLIALVVQDEEGAFDNVKGGRDAG